MVKFEVVKVSSDEEKHTTDVSCVAVYGDKVFTGCDDGKVKVRLYKWIINW